MALRGAGADVLTFPSAFTYHTGQAHWEALLRARAIENQAYVVAAAQAGQHNERRMSYGSSMVRTTLYHCLVRLSIILVFLLCKTFLKDIF